MDAVGFVLAGGRSSRMGSEKALVEFAGEPLVVHSLRILRSAGLTTSIAGARVPLESFAPVVADVESDRGPLAGICAALASSSTRWAVFLSVDLPLLPASLVAFLLETAIHDGTAITVAEVNGFAQTFPAVVDRAALPWLRRVLDSGRGGCYSAFQFAAAGMEQAMNVVTVEQAVQQRKLAHPNALSVPCWFLNVNEPSDLAQAEVCWAARIA